MSPDRLGIAVASKNDEPTGATTKRKGITMFRKIAVFALILTLSATQGFAAPLEQTLGTDKQVGSVSPESLMLKDPTSADPGDDYHYRLMASVTKAPVTWTHEESYDAGETLPWDTSQGVMELEEGMVVLGGLDYILEHDWYVFQTPPDKHQIEVEIVAFSEGSPTNATLKLYDEEGASNGIPLETVYTGLTAYDLDPLLDRSSDGDETWYMAVRDQDGSAYGPGYWYTIEVRVVE